MACYSSGGWRGNTLAWSSRFSPCILSNTRNLAGRIPTQIWFWTELKPTSRYLRALSIKTWFYRPKSYQVLWITHNCNSVKLEASGIFIKGNRPDMISKTSRLDKTIVKVVASQCTIEPQYTQKQREYLAFLYYYTKLNGYPRSAKLSTRHTITSSVVIAWLSLWQLSRLKFQTTSQNNWLN